MGILHEDVRAKVLQVITPRPVPVRKRLMWWWLLLLLRRPTSRRWVLARYRY